MTGAGVWRVAAGACLCAGALASLDANQIGYLWTFEELTEKADLIVIAEPVATEDVRRAIHPDLKPALPAVELATALRVLSIVKPRRPSGKPGTLRLTHYRIDWQEWRRTNPARPGEPPPGVVNTGSTVDFAKNPGQYLLFLRQVEGGGYEPLSGHTFPTDSVYLLSKPQRRVD